MLLFPEKKLEKRKWWIDCVIKWGNGFINSTRDFFIKPMVT